MLGSKRKQREPVDRYPEGSTSHLLLALIESQPRYGYELVRLLEKRGLMRVKEGGIYPRLRRMQEEGLLESFIVDPPEAESKRVYYRITTAGENKLAEWGRRWREYRGAVDSVVEEGVAP